MDPEEALWNSKTASLSLISERKREKDNCYCGLQDTGNWPKSRETCGNRSIGFSELVATQLQTHLDVQVVISKVEMLFRCLNM